MSTTCLVGQTQAESHNKQMNATDLYSEDEALRKEQQMANAYRRQGRSVWRHLEDTVLERFWTVHRMATMFLLVYLFYHCNYGANLGAASHWIPQMFGHLG